MISGKTGSITDLKQKFSKLYQYDQPEAYQNIGEVFADRLYNALSFESFRRLKRNTDNLDFLNNIKYDDLDEIEATLRSVFEEIRKIKEQYDTEIFFKDGYQIDLEALKEQYVGKVAQDTPGVNLERLAELYKNPPKTLQVPYAKKFILIDAYVYRKFLVALIQMIFNHMDLLLCYTGGEGTGKSCLASQHMHLLHWTLTEIGVIKYPYDIKDMFFNELHKLRDAEDQYFGTPYRIFALDEGNELNRQNWKEPEVDLFFQRLRRERWGKKIKMICIPVLGEMIPNIVLSRVNFIFELKTANQIKTGTLEKGKVNMYILPRDEMIYSPKQKRELKKDEIKQILYDSLKDKSYLKGVPKEILIKTFRVNGIWGFHEREYEKHLKVTNETFGVDRGITVKQTQLFMLYKTQVSLKKQGIKKNDVRYGSMAKLLWQVNNYWEKQPDLLMKYEAIYQRKLNEKQDKIEKKFIKEQEQKNDSEV